MPRRTRAQMEQEQAQMEQEQAAQQEEQRAREWQHSLHIALACLYWGPGGPGMQPDGGGSTGGRGGGATGRGSGSASGSHSLAMGHGGSRGSGGGRGSSRGHGRGGRGRGRVSLREQLRVTPCRDREGEDMSDTESAPSPVTPAETLTLLSLAALDPPWVPPPQVPASSSTPARIWSSDRATWIDRSRSKPEEVE